MHRSWRLSCVHVAPLLCQCLLQAAGTSVSKRLVRTEREPFDERQPSDAANVHEINEHRGPRLLATAVDSGGISGLSKAAEDDREKRRVYAAASLEQYQKSYADLEEFIDNFHRTADHMVDGFEESNITKKDRLEHLKAAKYKAAAQMQRLETFEKQKRQELLQNPSLMQQAYARGEERKRRGYDGSSPVASGFWASDRPDEERIDPENRKIYKFKAFRRRFPFEHKWDVEVRWKKLPIAPAQVRRVHHKHNGARTRTTLIDQDGNELVYHKDKNGFYHVGNKKITDQDVERAAHPMDYEAMMQEKQRDLDEGEFTVYHNYTAELAMLKRKAMVGDMFEKEEANWRLELIRDQMRNKLNLQPRRHGKAWISVKGLEGTLCSFNVEVGEVTAMQLKKRIERITGIPWEAQELYIGTGKDGKLQDGELLNKFLVAGASPHNWVRLQEKSGEVVREALIKRGKLHMKAASPFEATSLAEQLTQTSAPARATGGHDKSEPASAAKDANEIASDFHVRSLTVTEEDGKKAQPATPADELDRADHDLLKALGHSHQVLAGADANPHDPDKGPSPVDGSALELPSVHQSKPGNRAWTATLPVEGAYPSTDPNLAGETSFLEVGRSHRLKHGRGPHPYVPKVESFEIGSAHSPQGLQAFKGYEDDVKELEARDSLRQGSRHRVHITRGVEYEQDENGHWRIARQVLAKPEHHQTHQALSFFEDPDQDDAGIPLENRVVEEIEIEDDEDRGSSAFMQLAQRRSLGQRALLKKRNPGVESLL